MPIFVVLRVIARTTSNYGSSMPAISVLSVFWNLRLVDAWQYWH
jgi:hypothetical protein